MEESNIVVITFPCNLTLLSRKKVESLIQKHLDMTLANLYGRENFKAKSEKLSVTRTDRNELAFFSGTMTFSINLPSCLEQHDLITIKKKLNSYLIQDQVRMGIIPILAITEVSAPSEKTKKNRVDVKLNVRIKYRSDFLAI